MRINLLLASVLVLTVFISCKKGKEMKTAEGFRYIMYTDNTGRKAALGDYVTIHMTYRNDKDSVMFDTRRNDMPLRFELNRIPFAGSFEQGLTYMSEGDSAAFFVPADSVYKYMYRPGSGMTTPQSETVYKPGTFLRFDIRLIKLQDRAEAEQEILMRMSAEEKAEREAIRKYIIENNITVSPDSSGYYLIMNRDTIGLDKPGPRVAVDSGKVVLINYSGRFLDGREFDSNQATGKPYRFISGANQVIEGWEMVMKDMHEGDEFTLILPSSLAYGEEGVIDPSTGAYRIPPYTPLVFDIKIVEVSELPSVSGH